MRNLLELRKRKWDLLKVHPNRIIATSFFLLIMTGAVLLSLPISSKSGMSTPFIDALFTATSASCVTGLVVVDTLTHWSIFGQLVILGLIQVGGLGIITLTTLFFVLTRRKIGLKEKVLVQESLNDYSVQDAPILLRHVFIVTVAVEFIGAVILSSRFIPAFGWIGGIYRGFFHSISAFCNAGFDIIGNFKSLTDYNNDPVVLPTIASLIIMGGLGFVVWRDLANFRVTGTLLLHTKAVLIMTAILIVAGTLVFLFLEYNNPLTMGKLSFPAKLNAAFFHSVTTRTAGYNSLPTNEMKDISKMATIFLMFIGASPGSTGGGIKTTTFGVLIFAILSEIFGDKETTIFKKRVPYYIVSKSLAIAGLSLVLVLVVTTVILGMQEANFINVLYEVVSAFGTVGLTTGITPDLHFVSKILIILTMFTGRVGTLTFIIALSIKRSRARNDVIYPEGKIMVG